MAAAVWACYFGIRHMSFGPARLNEKFAYRGMGLEFGCARLLTRRRAYDPLWGSFGKQQIAQKSAFYFVKIANLTIDKKFGLAQASLGRSHNLIVHNLVE